MRSERTRLGLLIACALLSTSLGASLGEPGDNRVASVAEVPDAGSPVEVGEAAATGEDDEVVEAILARLSTRHTALPERERRALARTIVEQARAQALEPDLVLAVIEVESAGYHLAVSHVGAMGLMQLLPATGQELAERLEIAWHGDDTLFDPITNVKLGTAYLRQLTDRYGDVSIALAAYNWGPGRIDRRLRRGATVPSRYIEQVMRIYDRTGRTASRRS
jgi:soluble lytic murein transglycosylase